MVTFIFYHRDGGYETSPSLGQYCGSNLPPRIISHSNKLWLKFQSDALDSGPGFSAYWDGSLTGKELKAAFSWRVQPARFLDSWIAMLLFIFFLLYFVITICNKLQHCKYFWVNSRHLGFVFERQSKGVCSSSLVYFIKLVVLVRKRKIQGCELSLEVGYSLVITVLFCNLV